MIGKALLRSLLAVFAVVMIIVILLLTPVGLHISLFIAKQALPGDLQYQKVSGILIGPITIKKLHYSDSQTTVDIKQLRWQWTLSALFAKTVKIHDLDARGIRIIHKTSETPTQKPDDITKTTFKLPKLNLPFSFAIGKAKLYNIKIGTAPDQIQYHIKAATLAGVLANKKISLKLNAQFLKPHPILAKLSMHGNINDYQLQLAITSPYLKGFITGQGDAKHIKLTTRESRALNGTASANINFRWAPSLQWQVNLKAKHLNLKQLHSNWPKEISADIKSQGEIVNNQPHFTLTSHITTPEASIQLAVKHQQQWNIQWQVNIKKLESLILGGYGAIQSKGELRGSLTRPQTKGTLTANNVYYEGYRAKQLTSQWNVNLAKQTVSNFNGNRTHLVIPRPTSSSRGLTAGSIALRAVARKTRLDSGFRHNDGQVITFNVHAVDLDIRGFVLQNLNIKGSGNLKSHQITTAFTLNNIHFKTQLQGGLFNSLWQGHFKQFNIDSNQYGQWQLASPSKVTFSTHSVNLAPLCLTTRYKEQLCMQGHWQKGQAWALQLKGDAIRLNSLASLLPHPLKLNNRLYINAKATGISDQIKQGQLKVRFTKGNLNLRVGKKTIRHQINGGHFTAVFNKSGLKGQVNLSMNQRDYIRGQFAIPQFQINKPLQSQNITGNINIQLRNVDVLSAFIPAALVAKGSLTTKLKLGGTIAKPSVSGETKYIGALEIPSLGLSLSKIRVKLNAQNQLIHFEAAAYSAGNPIAINGKLDLSQSGLPIEATLFTKNTLIINTPEYMIYATAKLKAKIQSNNIQLKGNILIPKANIAPHIAENVKTIPTNEIVFIGKDDDKAKPWNITAAINLTLGKNVSVNVVGINTKVKGHALINAKPKQPTIATGAISAYQGTFSKAGITLDIAPGSKVKFLKSPINNPQLDVSASKKIITLYNGGSQQLPSEQVTVGMHVLGTLKRPKITLFSKPATLSQADILSYLILGYPTGGKATGTATILRALDTLKLGDQKSGTGGVTSEIRQALGFSELGVGAATTTDAIGNLVGEQSSFIVGRRISPRVYLRYSVGLGGSGLTTANILQVRYLLSQHWMLQTDSSNLGNGVDIFYTINK